MGLLRRATKEIKALQSEIRAERVRAEKAESQFDELAVETNRIHQDRKEAWRQRLVWRMRAEQAEADLAEAREVLRALRPVLKIIDGGAWPRALVEPEIREAKRKHPWLEEWLND